jgi:hypothetical protein
MFYEERIYTVQQGQVQRYLENYEKHALALQCSIVGPFVGFFYNKDESANQIVHFWQYQSLNDRERLRSTLAERKEWAGYLAMNSPLLIAQQNRLLRPQIIPSSAIDGSGRRDRGRIYQRIVCRLRPYQSARYVRDYLQEALPIEQAVYGEPFGVFATEIGTLNELTIVWKLQSEQALVEAMASLRARADWQEFERRNASIIIDRSTSTLVPAAFMTDAC